MNKLTVSLLAMMVMVLVESSPVLALSMPAPQIKSISVIDIEDDTVIADWNIDGFRRYTLDPVVAAKIDFSKVIEEIGIKCNFSSGNNYFICETEESIMRKSLNLDEKVVEALKKATGNEGMHIKLLGDATKKVPKIN